MHNKIAFLLMTVLFIATSCQDYEIPDNQSDNLTILNDLVHKQDGKSYPAQITSFVTDANELGVKVDGEDNKLYILQNNEMPNDLNLNGINGHLVYLKDALVIGTKTKNYFLGLDKTEERDQNIFEEVESKIDLEDSIFGYGLTEIEVDNFDKYNFSSDKSIYYSLLEPTVNKNDIMSFLKEPVCQHGGRGAISCSASSPSGVTCSTSCGSGYYACCNNVPLSCKCQPDNP